MQKVPWSEWKPRYERIVERLKLDPRQDEAARDKIARINSKTGLLSRDKIHSKLFNNCVIVFGAGPSLDTDIDIMKQTLSNHSQLIKIAADGATTALLRHKILPEIVVTDLDGSWPDLLSAARTGSKMVVHAHGDNVSLLENSVSFGSFLATTQVREVKNVFNFGGFTDGDRAAFLAATFEPRILGVAGMDLGAQIGEYSLAHKKSAERKLIKLQICKELLEWLSQRYVKLKLVNLTDGGEDIPGFQRGTWKNLTALSA